MRFKVKNPGPFAPLYNLPEDVWLVICIGGRGGKKTYEVSKFITVDACMRKRRVAIARDEKESIRESIMNEVFTRFDTANQYGHFDGLYERIQNGIKNAQTGDMQVFAKGFRASSNDKMANLKGISDVDTAVVEEAEDIRDPSKFNTFVDSIRTQRRLIVVILNTPDIQHWIIRRYFHLEETEHDGYWRLVPRKIKGFLCIQTSYKDNEHLPDSIREAYEAYGDKESPTYDLHYYLTAILGYASSGRKGQVIRKAKPIELDEYMALPFKEYYAVDFGTASPAGVVGVKLDKNNLYARELNYNPMTTLELGVFFARLGLTDADLVIADSADPLSIGKLRRGWPVAELPENYAKEFPGGIRGLNIRGVVKGPGSLEFGLGLLNGMALYFHGDNLWNEVWNYIYAVNKSGELTNLPIDAFNHLIDPTRYVAQSRGRYF